MKTKFPKKMLSLVLAFLMVIPSVSGISLVANASYVGNENTDTAATVNTGSYQRAIVHDPSIVSVIEVTFADGTVKEYPEDFNIASLSNVASTRAAYWIFGTHFDNAKSYDLKNWTQISSEASITMFGTDESGNDLVINNNGVSAYQLRQDYPEFDAMCYYSGFADDAGDSWAGDVVWNNSTQKWNYFGSVSSVGSMKSTIFFASSDHLSGGFVFGNDANDHADCFVLVSGFDDSTKNAHPYLTANYTTIVAPNSNNEEFNGSTVGYPITSGRFEQINWTNTNTSAYPNSIDPGVFYDKDGNMWMSYGSWHNGIWIIPLSDSNSLPDYSRITVSGSNISNSAGTEYDAYNGVKIANPETTVNSSGEGPFIVYDKTAGVYLMTVTYGGLTESAGYNTRCFYSNYPDGPYIDASGSQATTDSNSQSNSKTNQGGKLIGDYTLKCIDYSYTSPGHNSMMFTDTDGDGFDEQFFVYHSRYLNNSHTSASSDAAGIYFSDYIHRSFTVPTPSNGFTMVLSPFEYAGEPITKSGQLSNTDIAGSYSIISHGSSTSTSVNLPKSIQIDSEGNVSGLYSGTVKNIGNTVNSVTYPYDIYELDLRLTEEQYGSTTKYYGVFQKQYDESVQYGDQDGSRGEVLSFSIMGANNASVWGYTSRRVIVSDTLNAADSKLSVSSQIYTCNYNSESRVNEIDKYGTTIYVGSYDFGNVYDESISSQDYTAYLYLNSKYTLTAVNDADTEHTNSNISFETVSTTDGVTKYKLTGNVADNYSSAQAALTLNVSYTDSTTEYEELAYTYVMQTPVPAHAFGSSYSGLSNYSSSKKLENSWMVSAIGSYGSNGYQNYGNNNSTQTLAPNLCSQAELKKSGTNHYWNNPNHDADIKTGRWASGNNGSEYSSWDSSGKSQTTPIATYYIDKSDFQEGSNISVYIDSNGNFSIPVGYNNIKNLYTYDEGFSLIDSNSSGSSGLFDSMVYTKQANATTRTAFTGTVTIDFTPVKEKFIDNCLNKAADPKWTWTYLNGNTTNSGTQSFFLTNQIQQSRGGSTVYLTCDIQYKIEVFDKSAVRNEFEKDIVDENGNHLVAANYSTETWTAYQKAIAETAAYLNNYTVHETDSEVEKRKYLDPIKEAYENLFSYDEYTELTDSVQSAKDIIQFNSNKYITNGSNSLVGSTEALQNNINQYPSYINFTTEDHSADDFWRTISAKDNNYEAASGATTSKADYYAAIYDIQDRISELRERADYQPLYELSVQSENVQNDNYKSDDWNSFVSALNEVNEYLNAQGSATDGVYTATDLTVTKYNATTATSASGTGTITVDNVAECSDTQNKINDLYAKLSFYKAKLKHKADYTTLNADFDGTNKFTNAAESVAVGANEINDTGLGTLDSQKYTISTWIPFADAYNAADLLSTDGKSYTSDEKSLQPMYKDSLVNSVSYGSETVYLEDTGSLSDYQIAINDADSALVKAIQAMTPVDSDEAYQNYNSSQALFAKSDKDAYITDAVTAVTGYGTDTSALDYAKGLSAVYVSYNGGIYKNTTTGETDSYTSKVLTTINGGDETTNGNTRKSYTVTFNYIENGVRTQIVLDNEVHYYGDVVNMNYGGSGTVEGWDVTSGKLTPTSIKNADNAFSLKVQANTVVNVYATTPDNTKCVVKVLDYFGRAKVAYVDAGTVATVSGETVSFNDGSTASITNQSCSYYTFNGFAVSGSMTDNGDSTYTINGDTVFTATGSKDKSAMNYTVTGGTFADGSTSAAYAMDDVITITPSIANCIGIALVTDSGYTMLSYGESSFTFYAFPVATAFGGAVQLACVAADDAKLTDNQKGHVPDSFGLGLRSSDGSKISMYCMMTTGDSNAKIVERGIVITKSEKNEAQLIKGADGVTKFTSSSDVNSSQYLITIRTSASVWARSYVSYTVDTVVNGQTVNVPMVAYGEIQAIPAV